MNVYVSQGAQKRRNAKRAVLAVVVIVLLAVAAWAFAPFLTPHAEARTLSQATNDVVYYGYVDCPHHGGGKCIRSTGWIIRGLGGGRWEAETEGWECHWYEPCAFAPYNFARWNYTRRFWIENNGSRSHVEGFVTY